MTGLGMNGAVGDRSTGLAPSTALVAKDATVTVISAVVASAPDLKRDAGGVRVVVLGSADRMGTATVSVAQATTGTQAGCGIHPANRRPRS